MLDPPLRSRQLPSTVQLFVLGVALLALGATLRHGSFAKRDTDRLAFVAERQPAGTTRDSSVRHPVVLVGPLLGQTLVGPLLGQTLQVNDARWLNPCSPWTPTWTTAWLNLDKLAATCALHSSHAQLGLTFDPTTHRTKSPEHVQVRVAEGWDGLTLAYAGEIYGNLTQRLESEGFVRDVDILPMGYDWRLSVADWEQTAFPRFFRTISDAVSKNGQPVVLTGLSMAAPFTHAFLRWANAKRGGKSWVQKNVHAFVPVAGPFNGAVNALSALVGGVAFAYTPPGQAGATKFTCPLCDPPMAEQVGEEHFVKQIVDGFGAVLKELLMDWLLTDITRLLREFPSLYWMSPGVDDSTPDRSYVTLQHGPWAQPEEIKASGLPSLFRRLLMHDEAERMKYALSVGTTADPGVPTHCIYSHNVRTYSHLTFPAGGGLAKIGASVEIGDGDGTVHSDSLCVCERWKSTVKVYKLPGVPHEGMMSVGQVHDVIVNVAKGDGAALDAWTSPAFVDLDVPRDGMTNATLLDEWQANLVVALNEDA